MKVLLVKNQIILVSRIDRGYFDLKSVIYSVTLVKVLVKMVPLKSDFAVVTDHDGPGNLGCREKENQMLPNTHICHNHFNKANVSV